MLKDKLKRKKLGAAADLAEAVQSSLKERKRLDDSDDEEVFRLAPSLAAAGSSEAPGERWRRSP